MRVTEKLINSNKKNIEEKKIKEQEYVEMYMEREKKKESINVSGSVFESKFSYGINKDKSVFDKKSVFK